MSIETKCGCLVGQQCYRCAPRSIQRHISSSHASIDGKGVVTLHPDGRARIVTDDAPMSVTLREAAAALRRILDSDVPLRPQLEGLYNNMITPRRPSDGMSMRCWHCNDPQSTVACEQCGHVFCEAHGEPIQHLCEGDGDA